MKSKLVCAALVVFTLGGCSARNEEAWILLFPPSAAVILPKLYMEKTYDDLTKDKPQPTKLQAAKADDCGNKPIEDEADKTEWVSP